MKRRRTTPRKAQHEERKVERKERIIEHEEKENGESGAQAELEPHFILDLGFFFLFRSNGSAHINFFPITGTHSFFAL